MVKKIQLSILFFLFIIYFTPHPTYADEKEKSTSASFVASSSATTLELNTDTRAKTLKAFLEQYDSDLAPEAQTFVEEADKNNIDWTLVAAISGVESTWAHAEPANCYNGWGYGIYPGHMRCFPSYKEAITIISYDLRHLYMNQWGATDVYSIGSHYAASPTWAARVDNNMKQISAFEAKTTNPTLPISL